MENAMSDNNRAVVFPEYVDTLPQFLFLESDDISVFIVGMMAGVVLRYALRSAFGMLAGTRWCANSASPAPPKPAAS